MDKWRFFSDSGDIAYNLGITETLIRSVGNERALNTMRVSYCNPNSVILGIQHNLNEVINLEEIRNLKFNIGRRITSGPPLLFTDKQILIQFIVRKKRSNSNEEKEKLIEVFLNFLHDIGIKAVYEEPYKLLLNNKMLGYIDEISINNCLCLSFLINLENDDEYKKKVFSDKYPMSQKLNYTTNLKHELNENFSKNFIIENLKSHIKKSFNINFINEGLNHYENLILKPHIEKHTLYSWVAGAKSINIPYSSQVKSVKLNTKDGYLTVFITIERGLITNLYISGDFYVYPPEIINAIEASLKFIPIDEDLINEYIQRYFKIVKAKLYGIEVSDFVEAIKRCIK